MGELDLPADLIAFLRSGSPPALNAGHYETVTLFAPEELRVETLEVTPNMAPFASDHPHADGYGHYAVPAINLVRGDPRPGLDFPAWLLLWLPVERRYGSYDLDHGDLYVFPVDASWSQIMADPLAFIRASDGLSDGPVPVEHLEPWHRYPWVEVEYPG
jgi:hypothetical protein